ncbi:hypothetical protein HWN40_09590 [Methanolobus zinderi]|jgi:hypothetical protein|uniref:DUF7282 domain-containing protein n=1 Tax=Methanolobus zinderi TaxID=536044 RepID=A0A7D5IC64_9EURY|nr:hypothetical protein [Methanolobus zinderi]QLC50469.1 hypothetical protein HWN40_09590 [Methanolobus zinderi]
MLSMSAAAQYEEDYEITVVDTDEDNASVDSESTGNVSTVTFEDQVSDGNSIVVDTVFLPEGGYIAIHEVVRGAVGPVVGSSDYLEPGEHSLIEVEMEQTLDSDQELIAMPHMDDGNEVYEFPGPDVPYGVEGEPVTDTAMITVESEMTGTDNESTVNFEDQSSEGGTVVVNSVFLPEGGYIVIHESANGSVGPVIGNTEYMEAGEYSDVEVTLGLPIDTDQELIAMPHMDDGNEIYEFPGPDAPYTSNATPVTDSAMITVESGTEAQAPGFGIVLAMVFLVLAGYLARKIR